LQPGSAKSEKAAQVRRHAFAGWPMQNSPALTGMRDRITFEQ
jgi:hypothetical protein